MSVFFFSVMLLTSQDNGRNKNAESNHKT